MAHHDRLVLVAEIASSYLRRNSVAVDQIATVVRNATQALAAAEQQLGHPSEPSASVMPEATEQVAAAPATPAVPIDQSVHRDYLVCLEDGQHVRTLKRHLGAAHGMTPAQYRAKWSLPRDYPLSAPAYSESRSEMAKARGLGRKPAAPARAAAVQTRPSRTAASKKPRRSPKKK